MNDEPACDVHDGLDFYQAILPKGLPAFHQVHDLIGQAGDGPQLDRAVKRDDLGEIPFER